MLPSTTPPTLTLPLNTASLTDPCRGSSMSPPITPPTADDGQTLWTLSLFSLCCSIFCTKSNQNALFCGGLMPNPFWVLQKKKKQPTNIKLHPALSALIPSHAYMHPPPSLQSSAWGQGSTPCSEKCWYRSNKPPPPPASFPSPLLPPFF